ncbi:histidine phosphatase family protein [Lactobacillus sp. ESL0791]|uniref:histidine phosphatase family protein n=1 Tax=Lactobacillus sp. ESL0791 TaxID=2983234 RepID=UPI0023F96999|nr:histidine phosphatase family protein [Lactobacillus sp. ESL0791]MDF7638455.1 histidine phosphatase family protein [Lactobacillus sp. ESL0791]
MKELYLMRHGETIFNKKRLAQGSTDSPLTEKGIKEAAKVGKYFAAEGLTFDHAYSSTQERASDTLELVTKQPYKRLKGLKELDFGLFEAEPDYLLPKATFKDPAEVNLLVPYGGESTLHVSERMNQTITEIMNKPDHQQVLIVSHGAAIISFIAKWMSFTEIAAQVGDMPNCCVLHFGYDNGKFTFKEMIDARKLPE